LSPLCLLPTLLEDSDLQILSLGGLNFLTESEKMGLENDTTTQPVQFLPAICQFIL